jgi:dTDP-4-dehydrorhamnose 3,5-epimerase
VSVRTEPLALPGAQLVHLAPHRDARGSFTELWRQEWTRPAGVDARFVQDNWARSTRHVLRGLHFQRRQPQGKLVFVVRGTIQDVVVDARSGSPTFGQWCETELSDERPVALWIPPGYAHGYCVQSDVADVVYKCTATYDAADETGVRWNDPLLGIAWRTRDPVVSPRDASWPLLTRR